MTAAQDKIHNKALELGFDLCGFTDSLTPLRADFFRDWVDQKKFAGMEWLGRNNDKRLNPALIHPETRSAIVLAVSYKHEPEGTDEYAIARYAYGSDYHHWMKEKLEALACFLKTEFGDVQYRTFVDTGPMLERDLAAQAGMGWIGKNTCLINEDIGSYVFLGVILTSLELSSRRAVPDLCRNCTLCLEACPTGALTPYALEPIKCLAYQTIEKRGERDAAFWPDVAERLVGCDICQEVCPWNFSAPQTAQQPWEQSFPEFPLGSLREFLGMTRSNFRKRTEGSALSRVKYADFMRNVFLVIAARQRLDLLADVQAWQERNPDLELAEWRYCVERLSRPTSPLG